MKRILLLSIMLLLSFSLFGCSTNESKNQQNKDIQQQQEPKQTDEMNEKAVSNVVEEFGKKLQAVSLLSPPDLLAKSMEESYGNLVSPELLAKWKNDPQNAPGRMVSSPWPDRIEIASIGKSSESEYVVKGEIIEITSTETEESEIAAKQPITLFVRNINNNWLIDDVTLGGYDNPESNEANIDGIVYQNTEYKFNYLHYFFSF